MVTKDKVKERGLNQSFADICRRLSTDIQLHLSFEKKQHVHRATLTISTNQAIARGKQAEKRNSKLGDFSDSYSKKP